MVTKEHILAEIKRTAKENGAPLGWRRFVAETGIKESDWFGRYWARWSEAIKEAGLEPNKLTGAYSDDFLLEKLVCFTRELGRLPVKGDFRLKAHRDKTFPNSKTFERLGPKREMAAKLIVFSENHPGYEDIKTMCEPLVAQQTRSSAVNKSDTELQFGHVYLLKSGRFYKIGRSNAVGRREYDLAIKLPEEPRMIHKIKTDDPPGIELYWHSRFESKRKGGEWFELSSDDVTAFKRRKFM